MERSHAFALNKYEAYRRQAREISADALPPHLKKALKLKAIDGSALAAAASWGQDLARQVDWDWIFANRYTFRYPKAFDLSVWVGNTLCSLSLGRPSYNGKFMRLDYVDKAPSNCPFSSDMVGITILAYETYATLIGAKQFRIIDPINDKVLRSYLRQGGFSYHKGRQGNPHYLVKEL
ncbi:hypothetical protein ACXYTJ_17100 [Gilvimarinus sp. F26214L]|uniref:hypothetical protein n=1 Tax=Gilvimarinus sp. DZF01 TaxID=3461371 RepID=UPI00404543B1